MERIWFTGYRAYELQLFSEQDPKYKVLHYALTQVMKQALDDGMQWVITGGQKGIEQMSAEAALALKPDYPELQVAVMLPFTHFSGRWKPEAQAKLASLASDVDFSAAVSDHDYRSPQQLRNYQEFMLSHTDGAILVYDVDNDGKSRYDYDAILKWQATHDYPVQLIDFDQLQEFSVEFQENLPENENKGFNLN